MCFIDVILLNDNTVTFFQELKQLADELRSETIFTVSKTGGHLGSSLGVVELTVALHHVFNAPEDKILWDVGHQVHSCLSTMLISLSRFLVLHFPTSPLLFQSREGRGLQCITLKMYCSLFVYHFIASATFTVPDFIDVGV